MKANCVCVSCKVGGKVTFFLPDILLYTDVDDKVVPSAGIRLLNWHWK